MATERCVCRHRPKNHIKKQFKCMECAADPLVKAKMQAQCWRYRAN